MQVITHFDICDELSNKLSFLSKIDLQKFKDLGKEEHRDL